MISLARANLVHDWRRHVTAIVVLVLAGLLMTTQLGLVAGFIESQGEMQRQLRADIIVKPRPLDIPGGSLAVIFGSGGIPLRQISHVWMHPAVDNVQAYAPSHGGVNWPAEAGQRRFVSLQVIDPAENSLTFPSRFPESLREVFETPGMIVMSRAAARSLQVELGDQREVNGKTVTVAAIVDGLPATVMFVPIFASAQTAALLGVSVDSRWTQNLLVGLKDGAETDRVIAELNQLLTPLRLEAIRPSEYASAEGLAELLTSPFGWILLGSAVFGLIVGCGIASATLRGAFLAQLKEFGSLRALGVSKGRMSLVAMEQAWWTGLASVPIAALLAHTIRVIAMQYDLVIALPNQLLIGTSILLMIVALIAGVFSLTAVRRVEPAELLR